MRHEIPGLTGLRFVAALLVLVAHALPKIIPIPAGHQTPLLYVWLANMSGVGMTLFFVLSGFVIHYNYSEMVLRGGSRGLFNFFVARFARLYPLYIAFLVFELLLNYSYSNLPANLWVALPYYLTMTQSWFYMPLGDRTLVYAVNMSSVSWSISVEWFFYCGYPLCAISLQRLVTFRANLIVAAAVAVSAIAVALAVAVLLGPINAWAQARFGPLADWGTHTQDSFVRWLVYFSPLSRLPEFVLGCVSASTYMALKNIPPSVKERTVGSCALWFAAGLILITHCIFFTPGIIGGIWGVATSVWFGPTVAVLLFCIARYPGPLTSALSGHKIQLCGEVSYSIYLIHLWVIFAFRWEAAPYLSSKILIGDVLRLALTITCIVGCSIVTWALIEAPARQWLRRFMVQPKTAWVAQ